MFLLYSFPKIEEVSNKWITAIPTKLNQIINVQNARVCSLHFIPDDFKTKTKLKSDSIPTIFSTVESFKLQSHSIPTVLSTVESMKSDSIPSDISTV